MRFFTSTPDNSASTAGWIFRFATVRTSLSRFGWTLTFTTGLRNSPAAFVRGRGGRCLTVLRRPYRRSPVRQNRIRRSAERRPLVRARIRPPARLRVSHTGSQALKSAGRNAVPKKSAGRAAVSSSVVVLILELRWGFLDRAAEKSSANPASSCNGSLPRAGVIVRADGGSGCRVVRPSIGGQSLGIRIDGPVRPDRPAKKWNRAA